MSIWLDIMIIFGVFSVGLAGYVLGTLRGARIAVVYIHKMQPDIKISASGLSDFIVDNAFKSSNAIIYEAFGETKSSSKNPITIEDSENETPITPLGPVIGHLNDSPFYEKIELPGGLQYRFAGAAQLTPDGTVDRRCVPSGKECILIKVNHIYERV